MRTCAVCGQALVEAARAPRQPDRDRWCSAEPGRYLPAGLVGTGRWVEPAPFEAEALDDVIDDDDLSDAQIEARFAAAKSRLRRAS